ncbi:hypothetical protein [Methanobrevibacter sp.]|uniref:hypothetical protein n=1 Tax=Methanobrevibacter sp. TaxID=66852 RepID=UPI0038702EAA
MSVFKQLEDELEQTLDGIRMEFELLQANDRSKDYRKFLKKLKNIQGKMVNL